MYLRDLLPRYLFWAPNRKKPLRITSAPLLREVVGFSRAYCYDAWKGGSPMTKRLALRLHSASRGTLPMEKLFAIEPRSWPAEKLAALAASRARRKSQEAVPNSEGAPATSAEQPDAA